MRFRVRAIESVDVDVRLDIVDDHVKDECFCEARLCAFAEHEPCELSDSEIQEVMHVGHHVVVESREVAPDIMLQVVSNEVAEVLIRTRLLAFSTAPFSGSSVLPRLSEPLLSVAGR